MIARKVVVGYLVVVTGAFALMGGILMLIDGATKLCESIRRPAGYVEFHGMVDYSHITREIVQSSRVGVVTDMSMRNYYLICDPDGPDFYIVTGTEPSEMAEQYGYAQSVLRGIETESPSTLFPDYGGWALDIDRKYDHFWLLRSVASLLGGAFVCAVGGLIGYVLIKTAVTALKGRTRRETADQG